MIDLKTIYLEALAHCAPARLGALAVSGELPSRVIAIGKCAGPLFDGIASRHRIDEALVIVPEGYPAPRSALRRKRVLFGGHPDITAGSFEAGRALLDFAKASEELLVLASGGASACADFPLEPWFTREELVDANRALVESGLAIREMNAVRKHLSAVKGGRTAQAVGGRVVTLVYSDVATGRLQDVGSGPSLPDESTRAEALSLATAARVPGRVLDVLADPSLPETPKVLEAAEARLIADNSTLVATAAEVARSGGWTVRTLPEQVEDDVAAAAERLLDTAAGLQPGEVLVTGGEVTVRRRRPGGRGGRCTELAAHVLVASQDRGMRGYTALFGSSDGVDGSSPAAAVLVELPGSAADRSALLDAISRSDTFSAIERLAEPIIIRPTGNNLRDVVLLARG